MIENIEFTNEESKGAVIKLIKQRVDLTISNEYELGIWIVNASCEYEWTIWCLSSSLAIFVIPFINKYSQIMIVSNVCTVIMSKK